MDTNTADKIKLHLGELRTKALSAFEMEIIKIYFPLPHHSPFMQELMGRPTFISEFMVRDAVRAAESNARQLLDDAVHQVSAVSAAPEAFALIDGAIAKHLSDLEGVVAQGRAIPMCPATLKVVDEKFRTVRQEVVRSQENYRSTFPGSKNNRSTFPGSKNKGGANWGFDWEGAEIYIKGKFPDGLPKGDGAQAKIARLMAEWLAKTYNKYPGKTVLNKHASDLMNRT